MTEQAGGRIFALNISNGGVPKSPIREGVVGEQGLAGDRQRNRKFHGGPSRALCLYSLEEIQRLQAEGHPIYPGSTGENVTLSGIDWSAVAVGTRLRLGDEVEIEITGYAAPCSNIAESFCEGAFGRISQKTHPGESRVYARILQPGTLRVGQPATLVPAPIAVGAAADV